ncbi:putative permease [compost metagenome]
MGLAFLVAAVIGWMIYATWKGSPLRAKSLPNSSIQHRNHLHASQHNYRQNHQHTHSLDHTRLDHHHKHKTGHSEQRRRVTSIFVHAADEVFDMGKYLIMGCLITAAIQSFIPRESLIAIGGDPVSSYVFMMGFAFLLSLCSTSDAFVASAFTHTFSSGSLLAFLVFGPMLDLKNVLMLLSVFRVKFVLYFAFLICTVVFIGSVVVDKLYLS